MSTATPTQILTTETSSESDDTCTNGGIIFSSGFDTNGNGILDPSEVEKTQEICFPARQPDNAANDAGDAATSDATESGTEATPYFLMPTTPPEAVPNQPAFAISMNGGVANGSGYYYGGPGGGLSVQHAGTLGGGVAVWRTGLADASFTMPGYIPRFGTEVLDVSPGTTLTVSSLSSASAVSSSYFLNSSAGNVLSYKAADATIVEVTGVHVEANATLIFAGSGTLSIPAPYDFVLDSNAVVKTSSFATLSLQLGGSFIAAPGAVLGGRAAAGVAGSPITISVKGAIYNQGSISTAGGGGSTGSGQAGGALQLIAQNGGNSSAVYNTGALDSSGGNAVSSGSGGNGAAITLTANYGNLFNGGSITTKGGDAASTGQGGNGGALNLTESGAGGSLRSSGTLITNGGLGVGSGGGSGGAISLSVSGGGDLINSGALTSGGANGSYGGPGGLIQITASSGSDEYGHTQPSGSVMFSGNIDTSGGSGTSGNGAGAGSVQLVTNTSGVPLGQSVQFFGYASVTANGGDAAPGCANAGFGGAVYLQNYATANAPNGLKGAGPAINFADITANGGSCGSANCLPGGSGFVQFTGSSGSQEDDPGEVVINGGTISLQSGESHATGGSEVGAQAQALTFTGAQSVTNTGAIHVTAGNATGNNGVGGSGPSTGAITFISGGTIANSAPIAFTGGSVIGSAGVSGAGGGISLRAMKSLTNSANISSAGGASMFTAGGTGGTVSLESSGAVINTGVLSAPGGAGTPTGNEGVVEVNGTRQ